MKGCWGGLFRSIPLLILCSQSSFLLCEYGWFPCRLTAPVRCWEAACANAEPRSPRARRFFSPKTVIAGFDHSFQIQTPNVEYLYAAAWISWFRGKKKHTRRNRHCLLLEEYCFIFSLLHCPVPHWALAQVQMSCHGELALEVISCICDYAERDVRKGLSSK